MSNSTTLFELKQNLRKKLHIVYEKNPDITDDVLDYLEASHHSQEKQEALRVQNKHEIREELAKELSTKADLQLVKTELQSEIKLSTLKTYFQTGLILLFILMTSPGGTHLLEKLFPFLR